MAAASIASPGKALAMGREREEVERGVDALDVVAVAEEGHAAGAGLGNGRPVERVGLGGVVGAGDDQPVAIGVEARHGSEELRVALLGDEPPDTADDDGVFVGAELGA